MPPINELDAREAFGKRFQFLSECKDISPDDLGRVRSVVFDGGFLRRAVCTPAIPGLADRGVELLAGLLRAAVPANSVIHDWDGIFHLRQSMQRAYDSYYIILSNPEWDAIEPGGSYPAYGILTSEKVEGDRIVITVCLQQFSL